MSVDQWAASVSRVHDVPLLLLEKRLKSETVKEQEIKANAVVVYVCLHHLIELYLPFLECKSSGSQVSAIHASKITLSFQNLRLPLLPLFSFLRKSSVKHTHTRAAGRIRNKWTYDPSSGEVMNDGARA